MNNDIDPLSIMIISLANAIVRWLGITATLWLALSYADTWVLAMIG